MKKLTTINCHQEMKAGVVSVNKKRSSLLNLRVKPTGVPRANWNKIFMQIEPSNLPNAWEPQIPTHYVDSASSEYPDVICLIYACILRVSQSMIKCNRFSWYVGVALGMIICWNAPCHNTFEKFRRGLLWINGCLIGRTVDRILPSLRLRGTAGAFIIETNFSCVLAFLNVFPLILFLN